MVFYTTCLIGEKFAKVEYLLKKYESLFKENLFLCSGMPR